MIGRIVNRLEEGAIALLLAAMVLVAFVQVVLRYLFASGFVWALELTTYLFAWLVLFGMSYGVKVSLHLGVDALLRLVPPRARRVLVLLTVAACMAYAGILFFGAWEYVAKMYKIGIGAEELPLPRWLLYSILPIGLVLLFLRFAQAGWQVITGERETLISAHEAEDLVSDYSVPPGAGDDVRRD
jgi:C4-dicarboxylate transporter DctQ subunit